MGFGGNKAAQQHNSLGFELVKLIVKPVEFLAMNFDFAKTNTSIQLVRSV